MAAASKPGHQPATSGAPVLGSPGTLLPVTAARPVLLPGSKSSGVPAIRDATLVTFLVPVTVATMRSVAVAPSARSPTAQTPVLAV